MERAEALWRSALSQAARTMRVFRQELPAPAFTLAGGDRLGDRLGREHDLVGIQRRNCKTAFHEQQVTFLAFQSERRWRSKPSVADVFKGDDIPCRLH